MDPEFELLIARPCDYATVVRLCKRAVGPGDYVLHFLRKIINDGQLFLVSCNEELLGMTNFTSTLDGAGWLSMARTDPDWRGKGVAQFIQKSITQYARKKSINTFRLWINSNNSPSIRAAQKGGFEPVADAAHVTFPNIRSARIAESNSSQILQTKLPDSVFEDSRYVRKMNGYLTHWLHFVKADRKVMESLVKSEEIVTSRDAVVVFARPRKDYSGRHTEFSLLAGSTRCALKVILQRAKSLGLDAMGSFLPFDKYALTVARDMGFVIDDWGKHAILFEKQID